MPKRLKKQLIIGGIYLGIFALILGFGLNFFWKSLSKDEWKDLARPQIIFLKFFKNQPQWGSILIKIKNPNQNYGILKFSYKLEFFDKNKNLLKEISGESFLYPLEIKYLSEPKIEIETNKVFQTKVIFSDLVWKETSYRDSLLSLRQINSGYSQPPEAGYFWIDGLVRNKSPFSLKKVKILAILRDKEKNEIGLGQTFVFDLKSQEERYFKILFSKEAIENLETKLDPKKIKVVAYANLMEF